MATLSLDQPTNNALQFAFMNERRFGQSKNFRASTLKSKSCTQVLLQRRGAALNQKVAFHSIFSRDKK